MTWTQADLFAPPPKTPLAALDRETIDEYRRAAHDGELFNSGAVLQLLERLDAAEALLSQSCDVYERPTPHEARAAHYERVRAFLERKKP